MMTHRLALLLSVALTAAACGTSTPGTPDLGVLPASFEGELPCADCPGVFYHVDLQPGGEFLLRTVYLERSPVADTIGTWRRTDDGRTLVLDAGDGEAEQFTIGASGTLTKLDRDGQPIQSRLNYTLTRLPEHAPIPPTPLDAMTWRLTHLGTERVVRPAGARPVTLHFDEAATRVTGSTGCNSLTGTYTLDGDALSFGPVATTKMFCRESADLENDVLAILSRTASHRIVGTVLELRDAGGERLALYAVQ